MTSKKMSKIRVHQNRFQVQNQSQSQKKMIALEVLQKKMKAQELIQNLPKVLKDQ